MTRVSVIMSVYNSELYLKQAIDSILNQTYKFFEFIIVNDCSNDNSEEIIKSFTDPRIILIQNEKNLGTASSLNKSIKLSKGEYLIRMDADDISLKNRIEEQVKFMDKNLNIGVAGSFFKLTGEIPWYKKCVLRKGSINQMDSLSKLTFGPCVLHPSVIIRKKVLIENNVFYDESFKRAQDYELWSRLIFLTNITNIPKNLFEWRISNNQSSIKDRPKQITNSKFIHEFILKKLMGHTPSLRDLEINNWIISNRILSNKELLELELYLNKLLICAKSNIIYDQNSLKKEFSNIWMLSCLNSNLSFKSINIYLNSNLGSINNIKLKNILVFIKKIFSK